MQVYHLSHTDLDGYSAQFVTRAYFKDILFYNSNYGKEINEKFNQIKNEIISLNKDKNLVLITDLNLTKEQCFNFESSLKELEQDTKILLLDHHQSGEECFLNFSWYFLDNQRSATKITYDFFSSIYGENEKLSNLVNIVNSIDIWLSDEKGFELGKVCLGLIANAKEVNRIMFPSINNNYMFHLIEKSQKYFDEENPHIKLDDNIHKIKKDFFKFDKDDTLSNLQSNFIVNLLERQKDKMTLYYNGHKGILTHNIGNVSVIGNDFLVRNDDFSFFLDVTSRKTISLRANGKIDVSKLASKLFSGGGHVNASGGVFNSFKDGFVYDFIKAQFISLIKDKQ